MNEEIKKELLALGEEVSKVSIERAFKIAEIAINDSSNKIDDMALVLLPQIKKLALNQVDKISEDV